MVRIKKTPWDLPAPFILPLSVAADAIDEMGHVNNGVYVAWLQQAARAHVSSIGLDFPLYRELNRAMVIHRHEIDYLKPAFAGEQLKLGTWVVQCDGRMRITRRYQLNRGGDCLLRAQTEFVCVELSSGRPRRLPGEFLERYQQIITGGDAL